MVTLDFPSLIERISQKFNYEAAMLGFRNVDLDPNGQMNIWLSSAEDHAWNPQQKSPETAWEAEIDRLMRAQASTADLKKRKESFDRVQEIVAEQAPIIYLVNQNALSAVSTAVAGANPGILYPQTFWNAERLTLTERPRPIADSNHDRNVSSRTKRQICGSPHNVLSAQVTVRYPGKAPVLRGCSLEIGAAKSSAWSAKAVRARARWRSPSSDYSAASAPPSKATLLSGSRSARHART